MEYFDILVVDDDAVTLQISSHLLARAGYSVATAHDGLDAIAKLSRATFRFILTDLEMPNLGGLGLLEWVRATPSLTDTPVAVLTGHSDDRTLAEILRHGADDYLVKPIKSDMLLGLACRLLSEQVCAVK